MSGHLYLSSHGKEKGAMNSGADSTHCGPLPPSSRTEPRPPYTARGRRASGFLTGLLSSSSSASGNAILSFYVPLACSAPPFFPPFSFLSFLPPLSLPSRLFLFSLSVRRYFALSFYLCVSFLISFFSSFALLSFNKLLSVVHVHVRGAMSPAGWKRQRGQESRCLPKRVILRVGSPRPDALRERCLHPTLLAGQQDGEKGPRGSGALQKNTARGAPGYKVGRGQAGSKIKFELSSSGQKEREVEAPATWTRTAV